MSNQEIFRKVSDFLRINNRYESDDDVWEYIYSAAYDRLMKDQYGDSPIERMRMQSSAEQTENKSKEDTNENRFSKKVKLNIR